MNRLLIIFLTLSLYACSGQVKENDSYSLSNERDSWIGDRKEVALQDSLFYLDDPSPPLQKRIQSEGRH
jgi:uncharacterized lipoprotein YmbA